MSSGLQVFDGLLQQQRAVNLGSALWVNRAGVTKNLISTVGGTRARMVEGRRRRSNKAYLGEQVRRSKDEGEADEEMQPTRIRADGMLSTWTSILLTKLR